ncbi:unannotated protein [freshwater metagenome]|uniref:Unannotated protein n=1 Tax=freshwater metagenome TaxID=449393 RepID=A0A6J7ISX7_9ZZZZ|nr:Ppx/GppA family phosphatase [Actinomycetota bacterium]
MRVAVLDIGTNSTRLLVADVDAQAGAVHELERESTVTRLGEGLERTGNLSEVAMGRVLAALETYRPALEALAPERRIAVLTSAARDAANGPDFTARVSEAFGVDARTIGGDLEARLSHLGATAVQEAGSAGSAGEVVVLDIGGGSTEFIVATDGVVGFHVSTQAGVVRMTERHIHHDPPLPEELEQVARDAQDVFGAAVPPQVHHPGATLIAVAGTATSMAAIDLALEPYDSERVHGHRVTLATCREILARLAALPEARRRDVPGLHPQRAGTILAGAVFLIAAMELLGVSEMEVSEHDILHGTAIAAARGEL